MEPEERYTQQNGRLQNKDELLKHLKVIGEEKVNLKGVVITVVFTAVFTALATIIMDFNVVQQRINDLDGISTENRERVKANEKQLIKMQANYLVYSPCIRSMCIKPDIGRTTIQKP